MTKAANMLHWQAFSVAGRSVWKLLHDSLHYPDIDETAATITYLRHTCFQRTT